MRQIIGFAFDQKSANITKGKHRKSCVAEEIILDPLNLT
jgi:hypothetical protein